MSDQAELAQRLIDAMDEAGDLPHDENVTVMDLLDDLACAGLRLVPDEEGISSRAYAKSLVEAKE